MNKENSLVIARSDFEKILSVASLARSEIAALLEEELARASVVPDGELPPGVVSMHSEVVFLDVETGRESTVTLVYPPEAKTEEGKISILAPVGSALIGLSVGQAIEWPMPGGRTKTLKVISVTSSDPAAC